MSKQLQLQFDAHQDHQLEAVESVVRLFEGLPKRAPEFSLGGEIVPNLPPHETLRESWLRENLAAVQQKNGIENPLTELATDEGMVIECAGNETWRYPSFTVEMETGTGKTYVYLRTIHELRQRYGFSKFVIVVPSVAIYEGVVKSFEITRAHFRALYGNETVHLLKYDSSKLSQLRSFANDTFTEIMVITLDAFNKCSNLIYKYSEKLPGERKPYQFIQETRPILILDEPQNMESDTAKTALRTLHPLFALRYSATPRTSPNLVYRLTPFEAFRRNLVKKIQVCGVTKKDDLNQPFLALTKVSRNGRITARIRTYVTENGQTREAELVVHQHDDLHKITRREEFKDGYRVVEINAAEEFLLFENGLKLRLNDTIGPSRPEIFRWQIEETIRIPMERQEELFERGVKVLSLFFIDRVANYTDENGIIKQLFDRAFNKIKKQFPRFKDFQPEQVREAYFAKMKFGRGEERAIDIENLERAPAAQREAAQKAFELIMKKKERLLSFDEPVSFIFAHSALKEGWDNPNVFQICTLNQAVSEIRRRQEIGRGLRLCVNQQGLRLFDEEVNTLTVIANESYASYAANLQKEYVDANMAAPPPPSEARKKNATRNDKIFHGSKEFKEFWERLSQKVSYRVHIDTPELIRACVERLNAQTIPEPVLVVERGKFVVKRYTLRLEAVRGSVAMIEIEIADSEDAINKISRPVVRKNNLARVFDDERLRNFQVLEIQNGKHEARVIFSNNVELGIHTSLTFESEAGQVVSEKTSKPPAAKYPVFNLLDRASRELGLTRPTLNAVFKGLHEGHKRMLFRNPEGFAGIFIQQIKEALADHIAERIEFIVEDGMVEYNLERLFPLKKTFAQRELEEADERTLYYLLQTDSKAGRKFVVQTDSEVERKFVKRVKPDDQVVFYFKFPASFRIRLPKVIGDYNPDWGLMRRDEKGKFVLQLIRETKFTAEAHLRFPHEKRKVACARKHFRSMNIDYRPVFPDFAEWWKPEESHAN